MVLTYLHLLDPEIPIDFSLVTTNTTDIPYRIHVIMVYMLTWLGYIDGIHVSIYTSTMDPMGMIYV